MNSISLKQLIEWVIFLSHRKDAFISLLNWHEANDPISHLCYNSLITRPSTLFAKNFCRSNQYTLVFQIARCWKSTSLRASLILEFLSFSRIICNQVFYRSHFPLRGDVISSFSSHACLTFQYSVDSKGTFAIWT